MSDRKTIQVNMDLFDISPKKTRKKKDPAEKKDIKVKNTLQNKTTKNKLLRYIREQQEKNYEKLFESNKTPETKTEIPSILANSKSDFDQTVAYMKTVEDENKKKHTSTIKQRIAPEELAFHPPKVSPVSLNTYPNIIESFSSSGTATMGEPSMQLIRPAISLPSPTYGCLKNGNLPTYRTMLQQTIKNRPTPTPTIVTPSTIVSNPQHTPIITTPTIVTPNIVPHNIVTPNIVKPNVTPPMTPLQSPTIHPYTKKSPINIDIPINNIVPKEARNEELKKWSAHTQLQEKRQEAKTGIAPKNLKYLKRKKTLRRTYNVGKSKVHPKVSVLVTNRTIRKKISTQAQQLKQIPIEEIRRYLTKKGLIKVGSIAPNDVLRQMYENAVLIGGDLNNHNPENLLYNYMNESEH